MQEKNKYQFNIISYPITFEVIKSNNESVGINYYSCFINIYKNYWISFDDLFEPSLDNLVCIKNLTHYNKYEYVNMGEDINRMIEIAKPYIKQLIFNEQLETILNEKI